MVLEDTQINGLTNCARCGGDHLEPLLTWHKFKMSDIDGFQYWATCPTTGDPVLLKYVEAETSESLTQIARESFKKATGTG